MSKETLVANELLAFLQQKLDVMDEVSAIQICKSSFSEAEVAVAKKLLYESLNKSDQLVSRRREGTPRCLQDIISLLKITDPDDVPTFVAKDLNKLPPVTFDHVDVTCLLKDIVSLKASLADVHDKLEKSQNTVTDLRKEVSDLSKSLAVSRSSAGNEVSNNNTRCAARVSAPVSCVEPASVESASPRAAPAPCVAPPTPAPPRTAPVAVQKPKVSEPSHRDFATIVAEKTAAPLKRPELTKRQEMNPASTSADVDGFITVQRKVQRKARRQSRQNHCGTAPTGPNFLLRAEVPTTLMYLSRLHYTTKLQDVTEYIKTKTNLLLRVVPLESRHETNFKAFVVRVPTSQLDTFMKENFWPKGVVYRRFRGRLPPTSSSPKTT